MISHPDRHRGGYGGPSTWGSVSAGRLRGGERLSQAVLGQHEMVVGQRNAQLFFELLDIPGKSCGAPGQAPVALPLSQVVTLHNTGINRLTDGGDLQLGGHGPGIPEHGVGLHLHDVTTPMMIELIRSRFKMARSVGEFPVVCQGQTCHIMLRPEGLGWLRAARHDIVRRESEGMEALSLSRSYVLSENARSSPPMPHLDFYFLAHGRRSTAYMGSPKNERLRAKPIAHTNDARVALTKSRADQLRIVSLNLGAVSGARD